MFAKALQRGDSSAEFSICVALVALLEHAGPNRFIQLSLSKRMYQQLYYILPGPVTHFVVLRNVYPVHEFCSGTRKMESRVGPGRLKPDIIRNLKATNSHLRAVCSWPLLYMVESVHSI